MAGEKNFENRLKDWLESEGIYPLGEPVDRMKAPPCGYWEKRWGGGRYTKSGLPDMKITIKGISLEVELKASNGTPSELQKRNLKQTHTPDTNEGVNPINQPSELRLVVPVFPPISAVMPYRRRTRPPVPSLTTARNITSIL